MQLIQNNALRVILRKRRDTSIKSLHQLANTEMVKDRLHKLCKSCFEKCITNENPLFLDCFKEFKRYANGRILKHETIICAHKAFIDTQIKKLDNVN
jgi:hypothetical protein